MELKKIFGDYDKFFDVILKNLRGLGLDVSGLPMSHLGYKAGTTEEYETVKNALLQHAQSMVENIHRGRPVAKIILDQPLILRENFSVSMIEVMPPQNSQAQVDGLEHCGFVIGDTLDQFIEEHQNILTGVQDQSPYCQPAYIIFNDGYRTKFYKHSLKRVVELEGHEFKPLR